MRTVLETFCDTNIACSIWFGRQLLHVQDPARVEWFVFVVQ